MKARPLPKDLRRVRSVVLAGISMLFACGRQGFSPQETPCDGVLCSGHGSCVVMDGRARCFCDPGFREEGLECVEEVVTNPCAGITCSGWGLCAVRNQQPYCVCAEGYHSPPGNPITCVPNVQPCTGADGTPCDDGQFCTTGDTCRGGLCLGTPNACDDGDPCTVDLCDETYDGCIHNPGADGTYCDDGVFCTVGDHCLAGACAGGEARNCDDANPCTLDTCDAGLDTCVHDPFLADGLPCEDGAFCTIEERCLGGGCTGGRARDCADLDACTADSCDEVNDRCGHQPISEGEPCDDGLWCTVAEACHGGACGQGSARDCSDGNGCTADTCDEIGDRCNHVALPDGTACEDGAFCITGESCRAGACSGGGPRDCGDGNPCTLDTCDEQNDACTHDGPAMNGASCDDGNYCLVGERCQNGVCGGASVRSCDDGNDCTLDACDEQNDRCTHTNRPNGFGCEDGLFCTSGDSCQNGACVSGTQNTCTVSNPCTSNCDEVNDSCGGCVPAGTRCLNAVQQATCDGSCGMTELVICPYGCNAARQRCNDCTPSSVECKADAQLLCNARVVCTADGRIQSKTCCSSNRCTCDGAMCLEDACASAPDLSGGGNLSGTTCDNQDNVPGDCAPGGTACRTPAQGGSPEEFFRFRLDNGSSTSAFYNVTIDSAGSSLDTTLRLSGSCGNEALQLPRAGVCLSPADTEPALACTQNPGADVLRLCGLPEGEYFGAVDGTAGQCGSYGLTVSISSPLSLDVPAASGNISNGGVFRGNTCSLNDDFAFPDTVLWSSGGCGNCVHTSEGYPCPNCGVLAAADCTLPVNSVDDHCTFSGAGSKDAVFYLALPVQSGVDISTAGSDFDTVIYLMETGVSGPTPPGAVRICNDDCWTSNGPSHIQTSLAAGLYYLYLDGAGGACGNYVLNVVISPAALCGNARCELPYETCSRCGPDCSCPNCGNGVLDPAEECDDGDTDPGDGCNAVCGIEAGYHCVLQPSQCGLVRHYPVSCACAIPDCTASGGAGSACTSSNYGTLTSTASVSPACEVLDVSVDVNVTHSFRGDLSLELTSPAGTTVMLKANSPTDSGVNVIGNFPATLPVEGPGALSDFRGQAGAGTWTLTIHDWYKGDTGTLNTWALHLTCR